MMELSLIRADSLLANVQLTESRRIEWCVLTIYVHTESSLFIKVMPIDNLQSTTDDSVLGSGYWHLRLATPSEETILLSAYLLPCPNHCTVFVDRNNDALAIKQLRILIGKIPI